MARRIGQFLSLVLFAHLSACGGNASAVDGASCFPDDAKRWIASPSEEATALRDPGGPYSIYLDGSASMVGYIRGATPDERPLADLVGMLPQLDTIDRGKVEAVRFDRKLSTLSNADLARMKTEAGYLCAQGSASCDSQESHIDQALARAAAGPSNSLSVIVSDLWLANSEILTSDGVALSKPLSDIFSSGRSVAVYGFESPYQGRVSDLPSGSRTVTANRRYLFVVAIGPLARVRAFHKAMQTAPSASIARDLASGKARYSLFTLDSVLAPSGRANAFDLEPKSPFSKATFLTVRSGVHVPQFHLDKGKALRAADPASVPGVVWQGISDSAILPGAVWKGETRGKALLYRQASDKCAAKGGDWRPYGELHGGWQSAGNGSFRLDPAEAATLPTGRYLIVGSLKRISLLSPNPATQWMRDWSFGSLNEAEAVKRPVMPTLNLAETARLLEVALMKSAEAKPLDIGGFAVAVDTN
jgi:hypothetical protein